MKIIAAIISLTAGIYLVRLLMSTTRPSWPDDERRMHGPRIYRKAHYKMGCTNTGQRLRLRTRTRKRPKPISTSISIQKSYSRSRSRSKPRLKLRTKNIFRQIANRSKSRVLHSRTCQDLVPVICFDIVWSFLSISQHLIVYCMSLASSLIWSRITLV